MEGVGLGKSNKGVWIILLLFVLLIGGIIAKVATDFDGVWYRITYVVYYSMYVTHLCKGTTEKIMES